MLAVDKKPIRRGGGPRTPAGKAKSSMNAVRHGAYSEALTLLLEDPQDFAAFHAGLVRDLAPVGPMEESLVDRLASLWWRMNRTKLAANQSLWIAARRVLGRNLEDELDRALGMGDAVALDRDECRIHGAWDEERQNRLLRHELTLERSFFRGLHELERLQARRLGQAVLPPMTVEVSLAGSEG